MEEKYAEELCAPLQFFAEMASFTQMTGGPPPEPDICYKRFQGVVLPGATWT